MTMFLKLKEYMTRDIWDIWSETLPKAKAVRIKIVRILLLTGKKFNGNRCMEKSATLTFITLLSIVPLVALMLGLANGFNLEGMEDHVRSAFPGQQQVADQIIKFAKAALETASGGIITGVGIATLFWTSISLLATVENSFNDIWGIKVGRTWLRKLSDYLTLLIVCPIVIFAVLSFSALGMAQLETLLEYLPWNRSIIQFLRAGFPLLLAWLNFFFLFLFIPNTYVKIKAALIGSFFTGIGFLVLQYVYMILQTSLTSYNAIYGGFAALPFFLLWLRYSWILTLLGAQFTFSLQCVNEFEFYHDEEPLSIRYLSICALRIMNLLTMRFRQHKGAIKVDDISLLLKIPILPARALMRKLISANLVCECKSTQNNENTYILNIPPDELTPTYILSCLFENGCFAYRTGDCEFWENILSKIRANTESLDINVPLIHLEDCPLEKTENI